MALTQAAIIVIVLCACLAVTALGAALFKHYNPNEDEGHYNTSYEQSQYMRNVRMRNYGHLRAESISAVKDLESSCSFLSSSPIQQYLFYLKLLMQCNVMYRYSLRLGLLSTSTDASTRISTIPRYHPTLIEPTVYLYPHFLSFLLSLAIPSEHLS